MGDDERTPPLGVYRGSEEGPLAGGATAALIKALQKAKAQTRSAGLLLSSWMEPAC